MKQVPVIIRPAASRTIIRPFDLTDPDVCSDAGSRVDRMFEKVIGLQGMALADELIRVVDVLRKRHRNVDRGLIDRAEHIGGLPFDRPAMSYDQTLLLGAYFSEEYSFESAALFNPSIVSYPDQSNLPDGSIRFILSLRGIGEGHISSVSFRTGIWDRIGNVTVDSPSATVAPARIETIDGDHAFTRIVFPHSNDVSESVIFPTTPSQQRGVEDMRLVRFMNEDGTVLYRGTYTAFNGSATRSELLETHDFRTFEMRPLTGSAAASKGMALFTRKIDGRYAMLTCQDNQNIWLVFSNDLEHWKGGKRIVGPVYPWEYIQIGNCGSPIEIEEGWLVITYGVGAFRTYSIGACLLDRSDPSKVLARIPEPLLSPRASGRDGYVSNVIYSCGSMVHDRTLFLPYGVADNFVTFLTMPVDEVLARMQAVSPLH